MPRVEHMVQRPDRAYVARSVVSSLDSCVGVVNEEAKEVLVLDSPEVLELGPDDGALVPVKRVGLTADLGKDLGMLEALLPVEGKVEAVPGMWPSGSTTGHALVVNPSEWDSVLLEPGEPVAEIQRGHASMCLCEGCSVVSSPHLNPHGGIKKYRIFSLPRLLEMHLCTTPSGATMWLHL